MRTCCAPSCTNPGSEICSGCKLSSYCSRSCQISHRKTHKARCINKKPTLGVSLDVLKNIVLKNKLGAPFFHSGTTEWVKQNYVLPQTLAAKTSYADKLLAKKPWLVSHANVFVSHAYDYKFLDVVDAIAAWEARDPSRAKSFYYFDLLVVNQHGQCPKVKFELLRNEFGGSVRAIGSTLLVLKWDDPKPLSRAWCVFEIGTTLAVEARFEVIMPPSDVATFKNALMNDVEALALNTCTVDVERATARDPEDLENIRGLVMASEGGYLATNQRVIGAMKQWMVVEAEAMLKASATRSEQELLTKGFALLLKIQGKYDPAINLCRDALKTQKERGESTWTLSGLLADILIHRGNTEEAVLLLEETLAQKEPGLHSIPLLHNLAVAKSKQSKHSEAERHFRNLLEILEPMIPSPFPVAPSLPVRDTGLNLSMVYGSLGLCLWHQRKFTDAEPLYRTGLRVLEQTLGARYESHPHALTIHNNLTNVLCDLGRFDDAEESYKVNLAKKRQTLGDKNPSTLSTLHNYALFLYSRGRLNEAEPLCRQAFECRLASLGSDHKDTLDSRNNLALILQMQGKSPLP